ncbi:hypothetical protein EIN_154180 [Entamoeba invadens IP1]|uniref:Uncharacterized protein n=2 Tax=Entamoeba invadens TaxID=33085 RepID=A0A0A1UEW5_ENTIV|nr:hypothetical protein EIN_154180 [Entamoeba invadens IP1]ELP91361.1 hypothetical protein EIN_154180 [Entamoeba invadens IP1]BAN40462.1 hypothetical protein [Entamoeba invadens]|eukprot:XP_004258132.1 hypothetical protein EIN_154180 [Entamoeba invadens IP1]
MNFQLGKLFRTKASYQHDYSSFKVTNTKTKPWKEAKYIERKKENQNIETCEAMVLLGLVNLRSSLTFEKPHKQNTDSSNLPRITKMIVDENDEMDLSTLLEVQCRQKLQHELDMGISHSTALRRFERNKKVFFINFLVDLATLMDFELVSIVSRKSGKTIQIDRVVTINKPGICSFGKHEILEKGELLRQYFVSLGMNKKNFVLNQSDDVVLQILTGCSQ